MTAAADTEVVSRGARAEEPWRGLLELRRFPSLSFSGLAPAAAGAKRIERPSGRRIAVALRWRSVSVGLSVCLSDRIVGRCAHMKSAYV